MVLRRKIYQKLLDWKNRSNGKTALMIDGARRVGKSYLCRQFGQSEYKSMLFIDFSKLTSTVKDIFENEEAASDIFFKKLSAHYDVRLYRRESLIVFDEVQRYPRARELIKHLVEDGKYDYIETGSLISLKKNVQDITIPSEEEHLDMFPLDFEEFLWAMGNDVTLMFVKECFDSLTPLGQAVHRKVMNDFRQYLLVGGMPQVVLSYLEDKDFAAADFEKKNILTLYRNDIAKFAAGYESKVTSIFDAIPGQLSRPEKRYKLSSISKSARLRNYEDAFVWLDDARVINPCFNTTDPGVGLSLSADYNTQKIYMADTGLLVTHAFRDNEFADNNLYRAILFDKLHINEGMLTENIVSQMLRFNGHRLFFYSRVDTNNRKNMMQIDFLITRRQKICPVEVKSSNYRSHASLDKFRKKFSSKIGDAFVLYPKDVMIKDGVIHLPLYMAMFL